MISVYHNIYWRYRQNKAKEGQMLQLSHSKYHNWNQNNVTVHREATHAGIHGI